MTNPEKNGGRRLLRRLWKGLSGNLPFKVLSLVLAVALWAGLISQDPTLTREKTFSDVTISVNGADTLKRNGFIMVSDLSDQLSAVMTVDVPQTQYSNAVPANYNPRIDLSRIRSAGTITVPVNTSSTGTYGSVNSIVPSEVTVEVEEYVTRYRIPVTIQTEGEAPAGYWSTVPTSDPQMVVVSGPRSLVGTISRAVATLNLSELPAQEGGLSLALPFTLEDIRGNVVESSLIQVTSESVLMDSLLVSLILYPEKEIRLSAIGLTEGEPLEGYEVVGLTVSPEAVRVAAPAQTLESLDTLYLNSAVNLNGHSQTFQSEVRLRRPSGVTHLSADTATVTVEIAPVMMERIFRGVRLSYAGLSDSLTVSLGEKSVDVTVSGPQLSLANVKSSELTATLDLSAYTEPGTYSVPVTVALADSLGFELTASPAEVTVIFTSR